jgi:ABC-type lipoprotein export system ATPase subunit
VVLEASPGGPSRRATNARAAVVLRDVRKSFPLHHGATLEVLDIGCLTLPAATCTVIRGRSGSGKTTLLNLIAGITVPSAGTIRVDGTDIFALPEAGRDRFRAEHIGYVFQTFNLLAAFSAIENVMLAMMFANAVPKRLQRQRAATLLTQLGLAARLTHKPQHLSRGEQQRVAIARALANSPPLILADEPCASLDARTAGDVLATFLGVCRREGRTLLLVSHDDDVLGAADRVLDMARLNREGAAGSAAIHR